MVKKARPMKKPTSPKRVTTKAFFAGFGGGELFIPEADEQI